MEKNKAFLIKNRVDVLCKLLIQQKDIKVKIDEEKAYFEKLATTELKDTKIKTKEYWGSGSSKVVVGNSETVKMISPIMLKKLYGDVFPDFFKEKVTQEPTDPSKRLLAAVFMGNYTEGNLDTTIQSITQDATIQKTLKKKLKGKYAQDKECLIVIAGLQEQAASDLAYLIEEVVNWQHFLKILQAAGWEGTPQKAIDIIKTAIIVDEGIKVTIETENAK